MSLYDVIRYFCIIYYHWREYYILPATSQEVNAQLHGAPPPAATIGERKLVLYMQTIPVNIAQGDDVMMTIGFRDEGKNANIQHVTFRMDISKDGKHILSDFFHDHSGEVKLRAITLPRGYQCFIELRSVLVAICSIIKLLKWDSFHDPVPNLLPAKFLELLRQAHTDFASYFRHYAQRRIFFSHPLSRQSELSQPY